MLWLILFVLFFVLSIGKFQSGSDGVGTMFAVLSICVAIVIIAESVLSIEKYPDYIAKRAKIEMLENGIIDIRGAIYKTENANNTMVSGSIENYKQSTNLSEYIENIYKEKSEFNEGLNKAKFYKDNAYTWIINYSWLIDSRIYDIKSF